MAINESHSLLTWASTSQPDFYKFKKSQLYLDRCNHDTPPGGKHPRAHRDTYGWRVSLWSASSGGGGDGGGGRGGWGTPLYGIYGDVSQDRVGFWPLCPKEGAWFRTSLPLTGYIIYK